MSSFDLESIGLEIARIKAKYLTSSNAMSIRYELPITVRNSNGKRIAIGLAFKAGIANQKGTCGFRFYDSLI